MLHLEFHSRTLKRWLVAIGARGRAMLVYFHVCIVPPQLLFHGQGFEFDDVWQVARAPLDPRGVVPLDKQPRPVGNICVLIGRAERAARLLKM